MSGLAKLYAELGYPVQGSDAKMNDLLSELEAKGVRVFIGHNASHVETAELVVYSSSIGPEHVERVEASRRRIPIIHRSEALQRLCEGKYVIAVSGTHGKTTTTSLIAAILKEAQRDPTVVVGGVVPELGGNACLGKGPEIVIEADESDASFLKYHPNLVVVTNIEAEHLDHYKDLQHIEKTFQSFVKGMAPGGEWYGCAEDVSVKKIRTALGSGQLYGFRPMADGYYASDVVDCPDGKRGVSFQVWRGGHSLGSVRLQIPGLHNVLNSLAAIAVCLKVGVSFLDIAQALAKFTGAGRRFDVKYEDGQFLVVDDYAHHPTEIQKTLAAAKSLQKNRVVAFFQPHRYSRTELLMKEFSRCFSDADKLFVTDIYGASEAPRVGVSGEKLSEEVTKQGHPDAQYADRSKLVDAARRVIQPGDLVLIMGAGDISQVARELSEHLKKGYRQPHIFENLRGKVVLGELMSKHTTLKIGGPAEYWVEPEDAEDLRQALLIASEHNLKVRVLGAGSNVLVPDEGLPGLTLHLGSPYFKEMRLEGNRLRARVGIMNSMFIQFAMEHGFGGFEYLLGIPGNIGGAIAMNAGSHGQWVSQHLDTVMTMNRFGQVVIRKAVEIPFEYRKCPLKDEIILEATFTFPKVAREQVQKTLDQYRDHRAKTQDLQHASAGCLFKNPDRPGCTSGRLIDESGLKGFRIGNAQVSEKHANFLINIGGATAFDVKKLIEVVRKEVMAKSGIYLETEVKCLE